MIEVNRTQDVDPLGFDVTVISRYFPELEQRLPDNLKDV